MSPHCHSLQFNAIATLVETSPNRAIREGTSRRPADMPQFLRLRTSPAGFVGHRDCPFVVARRCQVQRRPKVAATNRCLAQSNKSCTGGKATHEVARPRTRTNATVTASLTSAVTPARHLGPVAIFQWLSAWAVICLLLAVDFVWASQVGLTIGGGVMLTYWIGALLALSAAFRRRNRGVGKLVAACALWFACTRAVRAWWTLPLLVAHSLCNVMMERLDRGLDSTGQLARCGARPPILSAGGR